MELPNWLKFLIPNKPTDLKDFSLPEATFATTDIIDVFISTYNALSPQNINEKTVRTIYWKLRTFMEKLAEVNELQNIDPDGKLNIYQTESGISFEATTNGEYVRNFRPKPPYELSQNNLYMNDTTLYLEDGSSKTKCALEMQYSPLNYENNLSILEGSIRGELLSTRNIGGYVGNSFTLDYTYIPKVGEIIVPSIYEMR